MYTKEHIRVNSFEKIGISLGSLGKVPLSLLMKKIIVIGGGFAGL